MTEPFRFSSGQLAYSAQDLIGVCQQSPEEGIYYLNRGDFGNWLSYIGEKELSTKAQEICGSSLSDEDKLKQFLTSLQPPQPEVVTPTPEIPRETTSETLPTAELTDPTPAPKTPTETTSETPKPQSTDTSKTAPTPQLTEDPPKKTTSTETTSETPKPQSTDTPKTAPTPKPTEPTPAPKTPVKATAATPTPETDKSQSSTENLSPFAKAIKNFKSLFMSNS